MAGTTLKQYVDKLGEATVLDLVNKGLIREQKRNARKVEMKSFREEWKARKAAAKVAAGV